MDRKHHDSKGIKRQVTELHLNVLDLQMKRKRPSQPNGTASPAGEQEKDDDHHVGPELQRTGK